MARGQCGGKAGVETRDQAELRLLLGVGPQLRGRVDDGAQSLLFREGHQVNKNKTKIHEDMQERKSGGTW